jgi:hypothetical protein
MVERARVPDEIKNALPVLRRASNRYWAASRFSLPSLGTIGVTESKDAPGRTPVPRLPWPVGWARFP